MRDPPTGVNERERRGGEKHTNNSSTNRSPKSFKERREKSEKSEPREKKARGVRLKMKVT